MKSIQLPLLFSIIVTLGMNAFDMFFHYGTDTAVHLNYVLVKLTIIFLTTYLISQFIGISTREGIVISFVGPFFFWLYYVSAYPTLDRNVFRIDDQFYFYFAHVPMMAVGYFSNYWYLTTKNPHLKKLCLAISTTFAVLALEILYFMVSLKGAGIPEDVEVTMIDFPNAYTMLGIIAVPVFVVSWMKQKLPKKGLIAGALSGIGSYFLLNEPLLNTGLIQAIYVFIIVNLVFAFIKNYEKPIA